MEFRITNQSRESNEKKHQLNMGKCKNKHRSYCCFLLSYWPYLLCSGSLQNQWVHLSKESNSIRDKIITTWSATDYDRKCYSTVLLVTCFQHYWCPLHDVLCKFLILWLNLLLSWSLQHCTWLQDSNEISSLSCH